MPIKKIIITIPGIFLFLFSFSQVDSNYLKHLYDRVLDFDVFKKDSILYYADYIEKTAKKIHFDSGRVLALRLKGIYEELDEDYYDAADYYYQSLEEARELKNLSYEVAALGDLAIIYNHLNQPYKAKELYKEALDLSRVRKQVYSIFTNAANLGSIYNRLSMPDSALHYLAEADSIANQYKGELDIGFVHNNIGNAWFHKKEWDSARYFFKANYESHLLSDDKEGLWHDCLNLGDVYVEKAKFDSAKIYLDKAFELSELLESKRKQADVFSMYAKYYSRKGEYKPAFLYFEKWYQLDTALVNGQTLRSVAELQEKYQFKQKDFKNKELELEIKQQKFHKNSFALLTVIVGFLALSAIVIMLLVRKNNLQLRRKRDLIQQQNDKLAALNEEKNSLISVVSHDLSGPFTSIKLWAQILQSDTSNLTGNQRKALHRILSSAHNGETLIKRILFIDKEELGDHRISLEHLDIKAFLEDIIQAYQEQAKQKEIQIIYETSLPSLVIITDRYIVNRIIENLLSNAIKFSEKQKSVWVNLTDRNHYFEITIRDEGVGIKAEEVDYIFAKHQKTSSVPTGGEFSTGLGLFIVRRLAEELNGSVICESEEGIGSIFTVKLPK
ncbi:MAG: hypothetical protein KIT80_05275 [Chitinophagaceae bacterium]|nr:hypothetical protein [Chitinophagaceae bacterium]MCW5926306.1 hypothetical protein [Chitinophagaceae bacterium]